MARSKYEHTVYGTMYVAESTIEISGSITILQTRPEGTKRCHSSSRVGRRRPLSNVVGHLALSVSSQQTVG